MTCFVKEQTALAHSRERRVLHTCRQELAIAHQIKQFLRSISTDSRLCSLPSGAPGVLSPRAGLAASKHSSYATGWHSAINHIVYERNLLVLSTCDGADAGFFERNIQTCKVVHDTLLVVATRPKLCPIAVLNAASQQHNDIAAQLDPIRRALLNVSL